MTRALATSGRTATTIATASVALAVAVLAGCSTPLKPPIAGYTCCNLRPSYDLVSSYNVQGGPILPAGEPVTLTGTPAGVRAVSVAQMTTTP